MNYTENEKAIIFLSLFSKLTYAKEKKLLEKYVEPADFYRRLFVDENEIKSVVGETLYAEMVEKYGEFLNTYINNLNASHIVCLTLASENYPLKLKIIEMPPFILFAKGNLDLLNLPSLAVVGTRNPSFYGREVTAQFAEKVAEKGICIVSGLASGVDKISHENALKIGGSTIAVLGGGFNKIYPALNTNLAEEIEKKGLLLSEYCPSFEPTRYTFPFRNRIISALSNFVLITEAGEKSGALYTKDYAQAQGKQIFAIPSAITNVKAVGTNKLLKNGEAIFVTDPLEIVERFGIYTATPIKNKKEDNKFSQVSITEKLIIDALADKNQTFDELVEITHLDTKSLNSNLTMLQIRGLIKKLPGNEFSL